MRHRLLPTLLLLAASVLGCDRRSESPPAPVTTESPEATRTPAVPPGAPVGAAVAGGLAEGIYEAAKAGDWVAADARVEVLRGAMAAMPASERARERVEVERLAEAVSDRDTLQAMEASNALTLDFAPATAAATGTPVEVVVLRHLGRELEIGAAAGEAGTERLRAAAREARLRWDALRPRVLDRGGAEEAARFDEVVVRIERAGTAAEYGALAEPLRGEVDRVVAVFRR